MQTYVFLLVFATHFYFVPCFYFATPFLTDENKEITMSFTLLALIFSSTAAYAARRAIRAPSRSLTGFVTLKDGHESSSTQINTFIELYIFATWAAVAAYLFFDVGKIWAVVSGPSTMCSCLGAPFTLPCCLLPSPLFLFSSRRVSVEKRPLTFSIFSPCVYCNPFLVDRSVPCTIFLKLLCWSFCSQAVVSPACPLESTCLFMSA